MARRTTAHCGRLRCTLVTAALAAALCPSFVHAQTTFERTYGGTGDDEALSAQLTADGGCILTGYADGGAALVAKAAPGCAYMEWINTYRSGNEGRCVRQTADGGYIVAGMVRSDSAGGHGAWIARLDATGNEVWDRTFGGVGSDEANSVQPTPDGGYIICGYTGSFGTGPSDVWLIKTDSSGAKIWDRALGGYDYDGGYDVQLTKDGGYIITGFTWSVRPDIGAVLLVKTDSLGVAEWSKTFGGPDEDWGMSVRGTDDGGYLVAGTYGSDSCASGSVVYLIKTDANGDSLWTRTFGGDSNNWGCSACQTDDGGCIVTGYTESSGRGKQDVYLIRTDANGETLWTRTFGGMENDVGRSVQQTADGGYLVAGYTGSYGAGGYDLYLIKTDSLGSSGLAEESSQAITPRRRQAATVAVSLPPGAVAFDALGRRVLHPKPGVYFVREVQAEAQAIRKVIVQR